jgi:hypothetical protein
MKKKNPRHGFLCDEKMNVDKERQPETKCVSTKIYSEDNGVLTEFEINGIIVGTSILLSVASIKQFGLKKAKRAYKKRK